MDHDCSDPQVRRQLESHLINRALRDDEFRELLRSDPMSAIEAEIARLHLGMTLPPSLKIRVLEESADTLYLILPPSLTGNALAGDDFILEAMQAPSKPRSSNEPS